MPTLETLKTCVKCQQAKPLTSFFVRRSAKDGRASYCRDCQRVYLRAYKRENRARTAELRAAHYRRHRDRKLAYGKAWRAQNRARHQALITAWQARNPERVKAKAARYHKRHPERRVASTARRRDSGRRRADNIRRRAAQRRQSVAGIQITAPVLHGRFSMFGWRCRYCQKALTIRSVQADHRIPVSRGGLDIPANIVPACGRCNRAKWALTETEFLAAHRCA